MRDANKLRLLADWFDTTQSGGEGDEVQRDLRRIAERLDRIDQERD